ncbi:MAG: peptidoglycan DD-metalloendopeptidase family protein [Prevotella sp.]|nr:peptidoglycan DD-metalloendopeptidase family protein [Prevotella sp.]
MTQKIKVFTIFIVASLCTLSVAAQDLLARQAPIDRKMKAVDSLALKRLIFTNNYESAVESLYDEWSNKYAHRETALPDSFRISLRNFCMPTTSRVLTSNFGARWGRQHKGLDIKVYIGDTIRSAFAGKVRIVRYEGRGYGKYIVIRHQNGLETIYGHLSKQLVSEDQEVEAGEVIGLGGNTGRSTGSHLHFETRLCGVAINPALMFDFRNQDVVDDYYMFHKDSYQREGLIANRIRGVNGTGFDATDDDGSDEMQLAETSSANTYARPSRLHKVRKGETLSSIARKRGTSVATLLKLNHMKSSAKIRPGQILKYN